ncbi:uncharacterized protein IL334_000994 [Kwoniella shivajii]|uniref:thioredoxin-dependent peroxiredoxin n=1 Tax=Kwoniella shivajii TaxID=564305 RepID=A0ABZ1CQX8_9TREE|nr:hypothetical protein IL334_000994 [Kwoniella shivajii]
MAPKSTSEAPVSRRSARIADQPKSTITNGDKAEVASKKETSTKKRSAENGNGDSETKKTKTTSSSGKDKASEPKSKAKATTSASKKEPTKSSEATKKEKEAEAPGDAEPETGPRGTLKSGDKLPKITLKDNQGNDVDVSKLAGEKGVVIFLYPKADTPGCTTQACGYRDNYSKITDYGYNIYGLSKDKPEAQQKWITKKDLTYKILSDPQSQLIKRLGAFVLPNNTKRSHFIFEKGSGKLIDIALGVKPADDPGNVLKFLEERHK